MRGGETGSRHERVVPVALAAAGFGFFVLAVAAFHATVRPVAAAEELAASLLPVLGGVAGVALLAGLVFLHWLHGSYARLLAEDFPMGYTPRAAVIAWFIPVVNWVWPFRIMRELMEGVIDSRALGPHVEASLLLRLRWWWGLALSGGLGLPSLAALRLRLADAAEAPEGLREGLEWLGYAALLEAVATALLLSVVVVLRSALARPPQTTPSPDALRLYRKRAASRS